MARHQMLCIITPDAPVEVRPRTRRRLDDALRATGCVHFATLALLPGPAGPEAPARPSLLFEIVVDDGIDPHAAIEVVLAAGFVALWQLYRHAWPGAADAGVGVRRGWLREYLLAHTEPAACGFIGARDRSVAQIQAEGRLLEQARQHLQDLRKLAADSLPQRDELADLILRWAMNTHGALLGAPAPRSIWRRGALPLVARQLLRPLRLILPALALLALLGWLGLSVAWLGLTLSGLPQSVPSLPWPDWVRGMGTDEFAVPGLTALVLIVMLPVLVLLVRFAEALPAMLLFGMVAGVSLATLVGVLLVQQELRPLLCGLQLVPVGASAAAALGAAAATLLALSVLPRLRAPPHFAWMAVLGGVLVAAVATYASAAMAQGLLIALPCPRFAWDRPATTTAAAHVGALVGGSLLIGALLVSLPRMLSALQRGLAKFFEGSALPARRVEATLHQVHPSIDACEAALIGRQSHMISLTDVRPRTWWHGTWLRVSLWVVNQLADVYFADGRLGAADGIKFGHWRLIDGGRRLLFCSNYDGSFGGYLDEFIRGATQGVNLIWGRTELLARPAAAPGQPDVTQARSFPPVLALILHGCKYEQAFKAYARASMLPHLHRFEAYNLSLQDIERATRLRNALCLPRHPSKMDQILRALES